MYHATGKPLLTAGKDRHCAGIGSSGLLPPPSGMRTDDGAFIGDPSTVRLRGLRFGSGCESCVDNVASLYL